MYIYKWCNSEGGGCSSHTWSGLGEGLGEFPGAGDDPLATFMPFLRVRTRRVVKCGLVVEKLVLAKLQATSVVNRELLGAKTVVMYSLASLTSGTDKLVSGVELGLP